MTEQKNTIQLPNGLAEEGDRVISPEKGIEGTIVGFSKEGEDEIIDVQFPDGEFAGHHDPLDFTKLL